MAPVLLTQIMRSFVTIVRTDSITPWSPTQMKCKMVQYCKEISQENSDAPESLQNIQSLQSVCALQGPEGKSMSPG